MMARMILQMSLEEGQLLVVERALSTVAPWRFELERGSLTLR
jgi:hypothetical protein